MRSPKSVYALLCFAFLPFLSDGQLTGQRKFQLDSITTNIPKEIKRDLNKSHAFMDSLGQTDEEKVWMFYGYIGTHFKYDFKRMKDFKAPEYSPDYTVQKGSGICEDFGRLFYVLCTKSNIPCFEVSGKCPAPFWYAFKRWIHFISNKYNHEWNVVKYNGEWHLMDPTWTGISGTERIKTYEPKKKAYKITLVKSVRRQYYDPAPDFMMQQHAAIHPAFLLSSTVYTYKTTRKKDNKRKIYQENYPFAAQLDSLYAQKYPAFSKLMYKGSVDYSDLSTLYYDYCYELKLPLLKTARCNPPTVAGYDKAKAHIDSLTEYILREHRIMYDSAYYKSTAELTKRRAKLVKIEEASAKKTGSKKKKINRDSHL